MNAIHNAAHFIILILIIFIVIGRRKFSTKKQGVPRYKNPPPPPKSKLRFSLVKINSISREGKLDTKYAVNINGRTIRYFEAFELDSAKIFYDAVLEYGYFFKEDVIEEIIK